MNKIITVVMIIGMLSAGPAAFAQQGGGHGHPADKSEAGMPAAPSKAGFYVDIVEQMHKDMDIDLTGDPDVDFVKLMIPHHQSAIEMAKLVLEYGQDPEIRAIAEDVIREQEREIAELRQWLEKNASSMK
jgi:uncharacterized protein (DUF305 family)